MAIPARIIKTSPDMIVEIFGEEKKIKNTPIPGIKKGDYVLVHNKIIVQKISDEEFRKIKEEYSALKELNH